MPRALRAVVVVQLAVLLVAGFAVVARFPVWALVDELAHYDYVQTVVEDGRLPLLGRDDVHDEGLAIADGTFPGPPRRPAGARGLEGESYEAFQPPLYYLVAAPVFAVGGDHADKVRALRALGLVLVLVSAWLLWLLARRVFPDDRGAAVAGWAVGASVLLWPALVVRGVTISNAVLEVPLGLAALVALWDAWARRSGRALLLAGALVGCGLLVRLSLVPLLVVLVAVALLLARRRLVPGRFVLGALALPAVLLAPWVASNVDRYGAVTAGEVVRAMQEPVLHPEGEDFAVGDLPDRHGRLLNGVLAEEWWSQWLSAVKRRARDLFLLAFFVVPLVAAVVRPPPGRGRALGLLVAPLALGLALMSAGYVVGEWDFFYPRYLHALLPAFGLFVALVVRSLWGVRGMTWVAGGLTAGLCVLWAALATVTPFTP